MGYFTRWPVRKEWNESKHPRVPAGNGDESGQFTDSTNGGTLGSDKEGAKVSTKWSYETDAYGITRHTSEDSRFQIQRTAHAPTIGYAHNKGAKWWGLSVRNEKLGVAPGYWVQHRSYDTLGKAKEAARQIAESWEDFIAARS